MIQIDIDMPKRCEECPFCVDLNCILYEHIITEYYITTYEQYIHCPLKNVTNTNVGDTIYRQDVIDTIDKYISGFDAIDANFLDGLKTAKKLVKKELLSA